MTASSDGGGPRCRHRAPVRPSAQFPNASTSNWRGRRLGQRFGNSCPHGLTNIYKYIYPQWEEGRKHSQAIIQHTFSYFPSWIMAASFSASSSWLTLSLSWCLSPEAWRPSTCEAGVNRGKWTNLRTRSYRPRLSAGGKPPVLSCFFIEYHINFQQDLQIHSAAA